MSAATVANWRADPLDAYARVLGIRTDSLRRSYAEQGRWKSVSSRDHQLVAGREDPFALATVRPTPAPGMLSVEVVHKNIRFGPTKPVDVELVGALLEAGGFDPYAVEWKRETWPTEDDRRPSWHGRSEPGGQVYFIRAVDSGRIKIGFSFAPQDRFAAFQTASPEPLELLGTIAQGEEVNEASLHQRFADARLHGEWFESTPALIAWIMENVRHG